MLSTLSTPHHDTSSHTSLQYNARQTGVDPNLENRLCPGCKRSAVSENGGLVVAFGSSFFHVECFKCAKCGDHVTADTNLLLLSDGSPICANCSYSCNVCHQPILDEAIMTGDDSYHAHCFKCKVCKNRIDELVFAKTSQGIYCMNCHNERMAKIRRHAQKKAEREKHERERTTPSGSSKTNIFSPPREHHSPRNSANLKSTSPSHELPGPSHQPYLKSPTGSSFHRGPSKRKSIPYVSDAFASDTHISQSPPRVHSPVSPRAPPSRTPSLSVNIAAPPVGPAPNSAPLSRPSDFGDITSHLPYVPVSKASPVDVLIPSPREKNTLPVPPEEADGLRRRKSYDDGTRTLNTLFKQSGSLNSPKGPPARLSSTESLSVPTSRPAKRHSINPGATFNLDTTLMPSPGKGSPISPSTATTLIGHTQTQNGHDSPRIRSPLRQEFSDDSPSRPISHASSSTVFRSSRSSPFASDRDDSSDQFISRSRSVSATTFIEQPSMRPIVRNDVPNDPSVSVVNNVSSARNGSRSGPSEGPPESRLTPDIVPAGEPAHLRRSFDDRYQQSDESQLSGPRSDMSRVVTRPASRSHQNSPVHHADVPHNVEGWTDSEAESENGTKSVHTSDPHMPPEKLAHGPVDLDRVTDDVDPDTSRMDLTDLSDLSDGSPVEQRMSHATFIAPALPPIRFSMSGNDFSQLLDSAGNTSRNAVDYLTKFLEEEPTTPPPTTITTSSGRTISGNGQARLSSDDDRTAMWDGGMYQHDNGIQQTHPTIFLANGYDTVHPKVHTINSESGSHLYQGRASLESHAYSISSSSGKLDEDASQTSHSSIASLPGGTRITLTGPESTAASQQKREKLQLVKRRLQEVLADANDRGVQQLKLDRSFVEAIVASMEQGNQEYSVLKGKLDGVKRESRQYINGLTVAQTEYDQELKSRRDAEAEVTRLRVLLAGQAARLTALSGEHRQLELRQQMSKELADSVQHLEHDFAKLKMDRDTTLAEVEELAALRNSSNASSGSEVPAVQLGRSLTMRLDNIKTQYQLDILPLAQQREALSREVAELRAVRDVFLEETTVLNARNEELAQLSTLYTRRVESSASVPPTHAPHVQGKSISLERSRQLPGILPPPGLGTTGTNGSDENDNRFTKVQKTETAVEFSTPQSKGKFMKWSGSKAKDFVSSAVSAIANPEYVKGKPYLEHTFQQLSVLRFTRCDQCGDKMFGSQLRCSSCNISVHGRCINHVVTTCSHQLSSGREDNQLSSLLPSMFGRDLIEQVRADRRASDRMVPIIVEKCIDAVEALAMDYEGIYRKTGGTSQSKQITQLFEHGDYTIFDLRDTDRFNDICAVTSVLKAYFRSLPVPLLTYDLHDNFVMAAQIKDSSAKAKALSELVNKMPSEHYHTLRVLMLHLHKVQGHSDKNFMNARNLGVVFGPTLMRSPDQAAEFSDMAGKALSIQWLVENAATLFSTPSN